MTLWWAAGVAACIIVAIAVAIHIAQSNSGQPSPAPAAAKTASPTPHASKPTRRVKVPSSMAGTWSGQASQASPSGVLRVTVQVSLASGTTGGTVSYSGPFSCLDNLSAVSDELGTLTMDQGIVKGPCQNGVVTLIRLSASTMQFSFKGKGAPAATGTLNKTT